jgi:hypothetical protein
MNRLLIILIFLLPAIIVSQGVDVSKAKKDTEAVAAKSKSSGLVDANQFPVQSADDFKKSYIDLKRKSINKYSKEISSEEQKQLNSIVNDLESMYAESYEYHYVAYLNSNQDPQAFHHLEKAYEIYPNNVELYDDFVAHYELTNNRQGKNQFCKKLAESNTIAQGVMDYNYNVLMSLEPNAILFTNGSDDTYPLWIWQEIHNKRTDVTILNLDLIQNLEYQKVKLKSLNIYPIKSIEPVGIVSEVVKNNSNRPINVALTINPKAMIDLKSKLYLTGLVLKYSEKAIDNVTMLKNNWEFSFDIESLNEPVTNTTTKKINNNYILPLLVLNGYYSDNGKISDAKSFETLALKLAIEGGKEMEVKEYIEAKK